MGRRGRGIHSLPRSERLRASDFEAIFRERGRREEAHAFIALWRPREGEGKIGFAVGRRLGGAVERNRARRRLREAYRQGRVARPRGFDVIFVGRSALLSQPVPDLRADVERVLRMVARRSGSGRGAPAGGAGA